MASVSTTKKQEPDNAITMTVSLPFSLYKHVMARATKLGMSRSKYVRQLIEGDK